MKRLLLALAAAMLALLAAEGLLALTFDRSLRDLTSGQPSPRAVVHAPRSGAPEGVASPTEPGLYRVHPDPLVGYVLRANAELAIHHGLIRSDALGLRVRPAPARGEGALRIVVLGDSVAFGYGVNDDQTLAHQLELLLDAPPGGRAVECRTAAMPGWNHRNAVHFLLDHMDELAPDIVLYLPIANDLFDTDGIDETGHRAWAPDPAAHDPWLAVCQGPGFHGEQRLLERLREAGTPELAGASALVADLSPESARRYDENAASIALLAGALETRDARLLLVQYTEGVYPLHLQRHLTERGLDLPTLRLFSRVPEELTLGFDPHPSAATLASMAIWVAADLLQRGWVEGDAGGLPPANAELQRRRAPAWTSADILAGSESVRGSQRALLRPAIDWQTGEGASQIYGGVHDDGSIGPRALFLLERVGPRLRVVLAPIDGRPDLYPLAVEVAVDGRPVGRLDVPADGPAEQSFDLPATASAADSIEVRLAPERSVVGRADGREQLEACRVVRLASE